MATLGISLNEIGVGGGTSSSPAGLALLLENASSLLLEDGSSLLLETSV